MLVSTLTCSGRGRHLRKAPKMRSSHLTVALAVALTLAGCGGAEPDEDPSTAAAPETATSTPEDEAATGSPGDDAATSGDEDAATSPPTDADATTGAPEPAPTGPEDGSGDEDGGDASATTDAEATTEEAAQFPDSPQEYVSAWVEAWSAGDGGRAGELAAAAPSTLVTCLGTTEGEWAVEAGMGDMSNFAGGEGLWWTTVRHEPTGAELFVYTDQGLYGAEDAIVGADVHIDQRADAQSDELPPIEDCYATDVLPAVEAWGEGDAGPFTAWVAEDSRDEIEEWAPAFAGTQAEITGLGSMERYGSDTPADDHRPTVSVSLTYDDGVDRPRDVVLLQLDPEGLAESTDGSVYRVTYDTDRRFV